MKKAFLFARTNATICKDACGHPDGARTLERVLDRTVIVTTPIMIGAGAIVGDRVVTSLLLVGNYGQVSIRFRRGKKMSAFVTRRDPGRNLAELLPASRGLKTSRHEPLASSPEPHIGEIRSIGDPLLVSNVSTGVPQVHVAGTLYVTVLGERFEDRWKISPHEPRGFIGGAVWNADGKVVGLTIGEKIHPRHDPTDRGFRSVYALPAECVMDFVES